MSYRRSLKYFVLFIKHEQFFSSCSDENEDKEDKKRHPTSNFWFIESLFGLTGAILNSSVLYIFYIERQNLISTVNVMTRQVYKQKKRSSREYCHNSFFSLHTFFRLLYCFATFWRNVLMFGGPMFKVTSYGRELAKLNCVKTFFYFTYY